jgi:hypothetical protein
MRIFFILLWFGISLSSKIIGRTNLVTNYLSNGQNAQTQINQLRTFIKNSIFHEKSSQVYLYENEFIKNKKLISISPGGIKGFYLLGILNYIKQNYDLSQYIYSGASAGAWNGLFMCLNKNSDNFIYKLLDLEFQQIKNIKELEYSMKYKILKTYTDNDFDLKRLYIGVTTLNDCQIETNIFSDFENLEDAVNCCIASSHIPFITGGISNRYHNMYTFDGGFSDYPYLNLTQPVLHVTPNMWNNQNNTNTIYTNKINKWINSIDLLFVNKNKNFIELYDNGYLDAKQNKEFLDKIFL